MRTSKRKIYQTLFALCLIVLQCTMSVHAEGLALSAESVSAVSLVQSGKSVSVTLYHEHTQNACWERKWIPCGGIWRTAYEASEGATVYYCSNNRSTEIRNGVELLSIHTGWLCDEHTGVHDGEYVTSLTCTQSVVGTFTVTKVSTGTNELVASVSHQGTGLSDVSIRWKCPDQSVIKGERVTISQNGIYSATLYWKDAKTGVDHTTTIDYVEISNPIILVFQSGSEVVDEIEAAYGDPLPDIEIPVWKGHDFKGYYVGIADEGEDDEKNADAKAWYDEEGNPDKSITLTGSALKETLTAKWEARSYCVYYGEDKDGNGTGDYELHVTYGEKYGPIEVDAEERSGYIFDGYYLGDEKVFDSDGNATGVWRWDVEGEVILEAVYHKKQEVSSNQENQEVYEDEEKGDGEVVSTTPDHVSDSSGSNNNILNNSILSNRLSDNDISGNHISGNHISGNDISGNHISGDDFHDNPSDSERESVGSAADGSSHGGNHDISHEEYEDTEGIDRKPFDVCISSKYDSSLFDADTDESIVAQETVTHQLSENLATKRTTEAGMLWNSTTAVKAIEVTGITAGTLGLVYLVVWMIITKASLAELYSVSADGSRRRLGAVLILHGENAFHIHIKERMLEKGETGKYQMVFRKQFAVKYANQDMLIHCRKKEISEVVRPEIAFYIE